jgi:hypothetical protein
MRCPGDRGACLVSLLALCLVISSCGEVQPGVEGGGLQPSGDATTDENDQTTEQDATDEQDGDTEGEASNDRNEQQPIADGGTAPAVDGEDVDGEDGDGEDGEDGDGEDPRVKDEDSEQGTRQKSQPEPAPNSPVAKSSPVRIPLPINTISGHDFASRRGDLEARIRQACGGELCVRMRKVGTASTLEEGDRCDIIDTVDDVIDSDRPYVEIERGGELTVLVNVRCEDLPSPEGGAQGGVAAGAPLRIPLPLDELLGRDFDSGIQDLRDNIDEACGGAPCVQIVRVDGEAEGFPCGTIFEVRGRQFAADPDEEGLARPYVEVARGGSITLLVQSQCEETDASP